MEFGGAMVRNSIFLHPGEGIALKYTNRPGDSYGLFTSGKLTLENNVLYPERDPVPAFFAYSETGGDLSEENQVMADTLLAWDTDFSDPGIYADEKYSLLPPTTDQRPSSRTAAASRRPSAENTGGWMQSPKVADQGWSSTATVQRP